MRVAIVGGGFGGVYAIKTLQHAGLKNVEILLFEPRNRFVFTPLLHEVAADVLHVPSVTHEYRCIFRKNVQHIQKAVDAIDLNKKSVFVDEKEHPFDYIIIAQGTKTRYPEKDTPALGLKSVEDAVTIRRKIEQNVLQAAISLKEGNIEDGILNCIVVGGGPTGVELAGELIDFYRYRMHKENIQGHDVSVKLLQHGDALVPQVNSRIGKACLKRLESKGVSVVFSCSVTGVEKDKVVADVKEKRTEFPARCVIWTAGVAPNEIAVKGVEKTHDRFPVEKTLQLKEHPFAFAIGDASYVVENPLPDLAQVAVQQGVCAGRGIAQLIRNQKPRKFVYDDKGFIMSVGQKFGVGQIKGIFISGFPAWFIWRTVYLLKFVGVRSKVRMATEYTVRLFKRRS